MDLFYIRLIYTFKNTLFVYQNFFCSFVKSLIKNQNEAVWRMPSASILPRADDTSSFHSFVNPSKSTLTQPSYLLVGIMGKSAIFTAEFYMYFA